MGRTSLSAVPGGRAAVYAATGLEGAVVVTFFVAVQLLLNRHYYLLSGAQYGAVYIPVFAVSVVAALLAVHRSQAAARGRVFRLGLVLSAVGRAAMIPTIAGAIRHGVVFFPDLVIIGALTGAGFGLVYSAATAFALDRDPARPEPQLLHLNLTLAAGMAAGPVLQIGLIEAGLWWTFPATTMVLALLLIVIGSRTQLGPDAARSCALRHPDKPVPAWVKAYLPVALLAAMGVVTCVAWSQVAMIGPVTDRIGPRVLGLGAFWAALTLLARAAFSAIDLRVPWRRAASLAPFLLPAVVTVIGLAIGQTETTVTGIFLLAAVACAALLPPASLLTQEQLVVLPLAVGAGIVGIYPVAVALARPSLAGLRSVGATLPETFAATSIVAIAATVACAGLIASRKAPGYESPSPAEALPGVPAQAPVPPQAPPPSPARSCSAAELPPRKAANHEDKD